MKHRSTRFQSLCSLFVLFFLTAVQTLSAQSYQKMGELWYSLDSNTKTAIVGPPNGTAPTQGKGYDSPLIFVPSHIEFDNTVFTVTSIANSAFAYSTAKEIYLPSTIISIGEQSFHDSKLQEFVFPDNVNFSNNKSAHAFANAYSLKNVWLPFSTTVIPQILENTTSLEYFGVPTDVTEITTKAFQGSNLEQGFYFNNNIQKIGQLVFAGEVKFTQLHLPANIVFDNNDGTSFKGSQLKTLYIDSQLPGATDGGISQTLYSDIDLETLVCDYTQSKGGTVYISATKGKFTVIAPYKEIADVYKGVPSTNNQSTIAGNFTPIFEQSSDILGMLPSVYYGEKTLDLNKYKGQYSGSVTYRSLNPEIATVSGSTVTFHKAGLARIEASGADFINPVRTLCIMPNTVTVGLEDTGKGTAEFSYKCGWGYGSITEDEIIASLTQSPVLKEIKINGKSYSVPYGAKSDCFVFVYDSSLQSYSQATNPGGNKTATITVMVKDANIDDGYQSVPAPVVNFDSSASEADKSSVNAILKRILTWDYSPSSEPNRVVKEGEYGLKLDSEHPIISDGYEVTISNLSTAKLKVTRAVDRLIASFVNNGNTNIIKITASPSCQLSVNGEPPITIGSSTQINIGSAKNIILTTDYPEYIKTVDLSGIDLSDLVKGSQIDAEFITKPGEKTVVTLTPVLMATPVIYGDSWPAVKFDIKSEGWEKASDRNILDSFSPVYSVSYNNAVVNREGKIQNAGDYKVSLTNKPQDTDNYTFETVSGTFTVDKFETSPVVQNMTIEDNVTEIPNPVLSFSGLPIDTDKALIEQALKDVLAWDIVKGENGRLIREGSYRLKQAAMPELDNHTITMDITSPRLTVVRAVDRKVMTLTHDGSGKTIRIYFDNPANIIVGNSNKKPVTVGWNTIDISSSPMTIYTDYPEYITRIDISESGAEKVQIHDEVTNLRELDITGNKNLDENDGSITLPEGVPSSVIVGTDSENKKDGDYYFIDLDYDKERGEINYLVIPNENKFSDGSVKAGSRVLFIVTAFDGFLIGPATLNGEAIQITAGGFIVPNLDKDIAMKVLFLTPDELAGIDDARAQDISLTIKGRLMKIANLPSGTEVVVTDLNGRLISRGANAEIELPTAGVYIISTGEHHWKVSVK